jgi:hypothetical protein
VIPARGRDDTSHCCPRALQIVHVDYAATDHEGAGWPLERRPDDQDNDGTGAVAISIKGNLAQEWAVRILLPPRAAGEVVNLWLFNRAGCPDKPSWSAA